MKTIRNFLLIAGLLFTGFVSQAATKSAVLVAVTATSLLTNIQARIDSVVFINSSTNSASVWFYDSTGVTNYVISASTTYAKGTGYETNIFTNSSGIVLTNLQKVSTTVATAVSASTNERPRLLPFVVPASQSLTITQAELVPLIGLTVYSTQAGTINISYDPF